MAMLSLAATLLWAGNGVNPLDNLCAPEPIPLREIRLIGIRRNIAVVLLNGAVNV
jgi:hypothetical protein